MITGVVLARDEEHQIVNCLKAFRPYVDELILIDMESSDGTVHLARPYTDQILSHPIIANFDSARNIATPVARFDWLWFCDADERIPPAAAATVREIVQYRGDEFEAISIPFKTYFCGKWIRHCGWWPGYTMPRVLKRGHFHFREELHGGVAVNGREIRINPAPHAAIDHFSYDSIEHYFRKFNKYTSTEASALLRQRQTWDWRAATRAMTRDLWQYFELNEGHRDGAHGWILSWLAGQYRWASHAKLIDCKQPGASDSGSTHPENLESFLNEFQAELTRLRQGTGQISLGIVLQSPIDDPSGYADEGRSIVKCLAFGDRELSLRTVRWSDRSAELPRLERALYQTLTRTSSSANFLGITNGIPSISLPINDAAVNVLRTTFETDRIPDSWFSALDKFDEIWVFSAFNRDSFIRSGIAPEKIRIIPSCLDSSLFRPCGPEFGLPTKCKGRFVFLSVFDWQLRKGWDVLLKAYAREFTLADNTALLLKYSRQHGLSASQVHELAEGALSETGTTLGHRPDIVLMEETLSTEDLAALYRSVDAFVLASRGEGWGRPYMEAMACGLPVIGTAGSGNMDFMNGHNSFLVEADLIGVPPPAFQEISVFRGHRWHEPKEGSLRKQMRLVFEDESLRSQRALQASEDIAAGFDLSNAKRAIETAVTDIERRMGFSPKPPAKDAQIRVALEGEFLRNHSFSNINEALTRELGCDEGLAWSIRALSGFPLSGPNDAARRAAIVPFSDRELGEGPQVTIRHAYPPDWSPVPNGKWVHIQPWEFGHLPKAWLMPLIERVNEIWAPSGYVQRVYEQSGIPRGKIKVIPWGVDPLTFHAQVIPRLLPTDKRFRFVFVGGTIDRKGFDRALQAFIEEFSPDEDVCFVVKDVGHATVYRYGNHWDRILECASDASHPQILPFDEEMTPGQLASLYSACDCLIAPYRGEGFGLPVLEAMACGVVPIVPRNGATDEFVDDSCGFLLSSREVAIDLAEELCGPALELQIDTSELRATMRHAFENRDAVVRLGRQAAERVSKSYTWTHTADKMKERICALAADASDDPRHGPRRENRSSKLKVAVVMSCDESDGAALADRLARVTPFVSHVLVETQTASPDKMAIINEYRATIVEPNSVELEIRKLSERIDFHLRLEDGTTPTMCDWENIGREIGKHSTKTQVKLASGAALDIHAIERSNRDGFLIASEQFKTAFYPHLGERADTFAAILDYLGRLEGKQTTIIETGCVRMENDWGAGQSTLIFDTVSLHTESRFISIDNNPESCQFARRLCHSPNTEVVNSDSVQYLSRLASKKSPTIDILYLDSLDVDWNDPHPAALHHLHELCAAMPLLRSGSMVVVDDHQDSQGRSGKSKYVEGHMESIGAETVFTGRQIGWLI